MQKFLLFTAALLLGFAAKAQTTYTYDFNNASTFSSDWTVDATVPSGGTGTCVIASSIGSITSTNSFAAFTFANKSNITIKITSTASYTNISNISFKAAANDNSKPTWTVDIVDDSGTSVKNLLNAVGSKDNFNTGGTNKWGSWNGSVSPTVSGHIQFTLTASSSGKLAALDDVVVTYTTGGGSTTTNYTVTYNANGHGTAPAAFTGAALPSPLPTLTESGWTFGGWYTDAACTTAATPGAALTANITLYAKWTQDGGTTPVTPPATNYTITYNANGHGTAPAAFTGTAIPNPLPTLTENGWTFGGWYTDAACTTAATPGAALTANITLYAKWTQDSGTTPVTPPATTLSIHETEVYESPTRAGGYNTPLVQFGGREYEVYYVNRDATIGKLNIATTNTDKTTCITTGTDDKNCSADWLDIKSNGRGGETSFAATDEFQQSVHCMKLQNNYSMEMRIKGYSEFAIVAKDNSIDVSQPSKEKHTQVYIDGVLQTQTLNKDNYTIRRFAITPGEHVIKVTATNTSDSKLVAFSLQVAYVPKVKFQDGDTTDQVVGQTRAIAPIKYWLKNKVTDAVLTWNGASVPGISLQTTTNDTFLLQGNANAQVGTYHYVISAKDANGTVVSTTTGKFSIKTAIRAKSGNDMTVYQNNAMPTMTWEYDALSTDSIVCTWTGTTPAGLKFTKDQTSRTVTLTGTPTTPGVYPYTIVCKSGNTLSGTITVKSNSPTIVPGATKTLLYLYKDNEESGIFSYISTKYNYFARPASDALSAESQYNAYDAIVISEDVDATSGEVLAIIRSLKKPVLNMKIFTYSGSRLAWGDPNNGSITNKQIKVKYSNHPIFQGLSGSTLTLLSAVENNKGLMPVDATLQGTICLATAPKRGDDYESDGDDATFIHEVPASIRGAKYLTYPIALGSTDKMTKDAKTLFDNMITYLTSSTASGITLPELKITAFTINGINGTIDQTAHTINLTMPVGTDASELSPVVTLASNQTTVTPGSGEKVDFTDTHYGVIYTVSDGINVVKYTVKVYVPTALYDNEAEGLWYGGDMLHNENGVWVNIFNVSGQLITTTNSDFSFEGMPHGMYFVRSQTSLIKVMH